MPRGHQRKADLLGHIVRRVMRQARSGVPENDRPQRAQHSLINTILIPHAWIDSRQGENQFACNANAGATVSRGPRVRERTRAANS